MLDNTTLPRATLWPSVANEFSVEASQKIRRRHDLLRWIATDLDQRGPQLPITKEGYERLSDFCSAALRGRSFNSAPIKPHEIPMMIDPAGWTDTAVPRCGQRLVAFLQAVSQEVWAEGVACDFTSNASVSSWMMIDIGFSLSPHFRKLFKVRRKREHRVITTTLQGERAIGTHVHVRLPWQVYYYP